MVTKIWKKNHVSRSGLERRKKQKITNTIRILSFALKQQCRRKDKGIRELVEWWKLKWEYYVTLTVNGSYSLPISQGSSFLRSSQRADRDWASRIFDIVLGALSYFRCSLPSPAPLVSTQLDTIREAVACLFVSSPFSPSLSSERLKRGLSRKLFHHIQRQEVS